MPREKRIFKRSPVFKVLRYLGFQSTEAHEAFTTDSSANGIGLCTHTLVPVGTTLELWLPFVDPKKRAYTRGEVIWSKMVEKDTFRMGIRLEKTDLMGLPRILQETTDHK